MGNMLYFPNGIKSGIAQISDLKVIKGKINNKCIFTKLSNKLHLMQIDKGVSVKK